MPGRFMASEPFQMLYDGHARRLMEHRAEQFSIGDVLHVVECGDDRYEHLTGRELWLRVTRMQRRRDVVPTGVVLLSVELTEGTD